MFEELMKYSVERIGSIAHYYESVAKNISEISETGMEKHRYGTMIHQYLKLLSSDNKEIRETDTFKNLESCALREIEVGEREEKDGFVKQNYRFLSEEKAKKAGSIKEESRLYAQYADMPIIHGSSTLMMLVTRFEEFFYIYLCELYVAYSEKYLDKQQLSFSEIKSSDIVEISNNLVRREVEAKMRESYKEWFKIYYSHGLKSDSFADDLNALAEIYARRNILVHNNGVVNQSYLQAVPNTSCKLNEKLYVDEKYIENTCETFFRIILLMLTESSKLNKDHEDSYLVEVFNVQFELLRQGEYNVCKKVFAELTKKDALSAEFKTMSMVNYWICIIQLEGIDNVKEEIEKFDVSALENRFKMAKTVLLNDYDKTNDYLGLMLEEKEITSAAIKEWPLFLKYRLSDQYVELKNAFPEQFGLEQEEITGTECSESPEETQPKLTCN